MWQDCMKMEEGKEEEGDVEMIQLILAYAGTQLAGGLGNRLKASAQALRAPTPARLYTYVTAGDSNGVAMYVGNAYHYEKLFCV